MLLLVYYPISKGYCKGGKKLVSLCGAEAREIGAAGVANLLKVVQPP